MMLTTLAACMAFHDEPQSGRPQAERPNSSAASDWREAERGILEHHVQLTFSDRFVKAGESYFSPDDSKIIFQAVERVEPGHAADEFYAMFVADITRDTGSGKIKQIDNVRRISPKGSANTCGWFHPTDPNLVIFATTIDAPSESTPPGFQRASGRYKWMFPPEMRIVQCDLRRADGTAKSLEVLVGDGKAYRAEGSISPDARHLLYCSLESGDGDLYVLDLTTKKINRIVQARGYDGGPFFSPDGKRICYRSDRLGDNMLQLFVADLAFNDAGEIVGIEREYQLTDDAAVNWCPYWMRDGRRLIYSTSDLGEANYEVFMIDADPGDLPGSTGTIKYGTAKRRLTHFDSAGGAPASDVLPAVSNDGTWMVWASRRGDDREVHLWAAELVLDPDAPWKELPARTNRPPRSQNTERITITDHETGRVFTYDPRDHTISEYDMATHTLSPVTDPDLIQHVMELYEAQQDPQ